MATFYLFDDVVQYMLSPEHADITASSPIDFEGGTFRVALTNSAPAQATANFINDITQISTTGGYEVVTNNAGKTADNPTVTEASSGVWEFSTDSVVFTASGATMDTFQYPVLACSTTLDGSSNPVLIGYLNYGSGVSLAATNTFTITVGTNGWFQITVPDAA